jgi:hypothetical protein
LAQTLKLFARLSWVQEMRKRKKTIETLDEKSKLMDSFFSAVAKYKKTTSTSNLASNSTSNSKFARRYTHLETVQSVFDFLHWILSHSSLSLSVDQMDVLWSLFVEQQTEPPQEAEVM